MKAKGFRLYSAADVAILRTAIKLGQHFWGGARRLGMPTLFVERVARRSCGTDGLVFAKEWSDAGRQNDVLGQPLQVNNLGQRQQRLGHKKIEIARARTRMFSQDNSATPLGGSPRYFMAVVSRRLANGKQGPRTYRFSGLFFKSGAEAGILQSEY